MLGLELIHVSKRGHRQQTITCANMLSYVINMGSWFNKIAVLFTNIHLVYLALWSLFHMHNQTVLLIFNINGQYLNMHIVI